MPTARYVRLYADSEGESHFSDEEMELRSVSFAPPTPPVTLSAFTPTKQFALLVVPAGWIGDWHTAPHRAFQLLLVGEMEIRVSDGEVRRAGPGSILFEEDTTGKGHAGRNIGDDALVAVVQLAES